MFTNVFQNGLYFEIFNEQSKLTINLCILLLSLFRQRYC